MAEVIVKGGNAFLINPNSGELETFTPDRVGAALAAGFIPAGNEEASFAAKEIKSGTTGEIAKATALGTLRGASLGLSDIALTQAGAISPEQLRELQQFSPVASGVGEIGAAIATAPLKLTPFGLALGGATKLGTKAAQATARLTRGLPSEAIPRLAGTLTREGLAGGAVGLGGGLTELAGKEKPLPKGEAVMHLLESFGKGTAFGAGLGAAGWAAKGATNKAIRKMSSGVKDLDEVAAKRNYVKAEIEAETLSNASPKRISQLNEDLLKLTQEYKEKQWEVVKRIGTRAIGMGIGNVLGGGFGTGALGYLVAPASVRLLTRALSPSGRSIEKAFSRIAGRLSAAGSALKRGKAGEVVGKLTASAKKAMENPVALAAAEAGARVAQKTVVPGLAAKGAEAARKGVQRLGEKVSLQTELGQELAEAAGEAVGTGIGLLGRVPLHKAAIGGATAGIEGAIAGLVMGVAEKQGKKFVINRIKDTIAQKIAPTGKRLIVAEMTDIQISDLLSRVDDLENDEFDAMMQMQAPPSLPPGMVQSVTSQVGRLRDYIRMNTPPPDDSLDEKRPESKVKLHERMKGIRAVIDTDSFFEDFSKGQLSRTQTDAFKFVYPEAWSQLQAIVTAEVNAAKEEVECMTKKLLTIFSKCTMKPRRGRAKNQQGE
jgi:hypothetical protein